MKIDELKKVVIIAANCRIGDRFARKLREWDLISSKPEVLTRYDQLRGLGKYRLVIVIEEFPNFDNDFISPLAAIQILKRYSSPFIKMNESTTKESILKDYLQISLRENN